MLIIRGVDCLFYVMLFWKEMNSGGVNPSRKIRRAKPWKIVITDNSPLLNAGALFVIGQKMAEAVGLQL